MKAVLITSSILILLLAALRPLLRGRMDPRVQYALWLIVALRLLVPVEWATSAYSALALLDRVEEPARVVEAIGQTTVPILNPVSYEDAYDQIMQEREQNGQSVTRLSEAELADVSHQVEGLLTEVPTLAQLAKQYARPVWLSGAALMGLWFLLVNFQLRRKLRRALPVEADCPLPVRVTPELPSPCLCGTICPTIYVTPDTLTDPVRTRHVLTHELTHYRHRDHWWSLVRCLCLCVYWFNPLVWWAAAMSRQDCELACDAGAIRRLGEEERLPYGRTLVDMIASGRNSLLQTATTMTGGKNRVKERVALIARKPKTVLALALALIVVLLLAVGFTFTGAPEESPAPDPSPLSSDGLNTANLSARLMDVPAELYPDVDALSGGSEPANLPSALVEYWMHRPWTDYTEGWGWLLTVYRWNQEEFDANYSTVTGQLECFAKGSDGYYYVTRRASDVRWPATEEMLAEFESATQDDIDNNAYMTAFEAIRAYAMQTVLETEGVESYQVPGDGWLPTGTLSERLADIPETLREDVMNLPADVDQEGKTNVLASYWLDRDWTNMDGNGLGHLLNVYSFTEDEYKQNFVGRTNSGWEFFARGGLAYYGIAFPTDVRYYSPDDADDYHNAYDAIREYAIKTVLETVGVEPFTPELTLPNYYIDGMDYNTLVTSYKDVPEDPEQWFLVGQLPNEPVWMFTRNRGAETMFQIDNSLTQVFPYQARFFGTFSPDGRAPQLMRLWGGGNGHGSFDGAFAVITHLFQGGLDQLYQLTAYNLDTDPVTAYVHDYKPLMEDFNANCTAELDEENHTVTLSYQGQTAVIEFNDYDGYRVDDWETVQRSGFSPVIYDYSMDYVFNPDGTAVLRMHVTESYMACWTIRFTGDSFETAGFQFVEGNLWS